MSQQRRKGSRSGAQSHDRRLVGWLVSYALDEMGKTFEIRSGRTFIGSEDTKAEKTIVVTEASIAAAHTAMSASPSHQVRVQDIFTNSGTFVTRADTDTEEEIQGPIDLHHGDWIRIGDTLRFQLCMIDAPK